MSDIFDVMTKAEIIQWARTKAMALPPEKDDLYFERFESESLKLSDMRADFVGVDRIQGLFDEYESARNSADRATDKVNKAELVALQGQLKSKIEGLIERHNLIRKQHTKVYSLYSKYTKSLIQIDKEQKGGESARRRK